MKGIEDLHAGVHPSLSLSSCWRERGCEYFRKVTLLPAAHMGDSVPSTMRGDSPWGWGGERRFTQVLIRTAIYCME